MPSVTVWKWVDRNQFVVKSDSEFIPRTNIVLYLIAGITAELFKPHGDLSRGDPDIGL